MSSDEQDKTVFRQSKNTHTNKIDATIIRPTPGRRSGHTQMPQTPDHSRQKPTSRASHSEHGQNAEFADYFDGNFTTEQGLNPLVNLASTLIAVFYKTRQSVSHPNIAGLHQQLVSAIRTFEENTKNNNIKPEIVLASRYILCAALDEAVLNTPWGADSAWTQRSLLSVFHNETNGGEKFFLLLDRMKEYPADNLDILELMYILLSLGFEGKYRVVSRGRDMIEQIRDELYRVIRTYRGDYEHGLSGAWQGIGKTRNSLTHYMPMWVITSIAIGILVLTYSGFRYWLHQSTEYAATQLNTIAKIDVLKSNSTTK